MPLTLEELMPVRSGLENAWRLAAILINWGNWTWADANLHFVHDIGRALAEIVQDEFFWQNWDANRIEMGGQAGCIANMVGQLHAGRRRSGRGSGDLVKVLRRSETSRWIVLISSSSETQSSS